MSEGFADFTKKWSSFHSGVKVRGAILLWLKVSYKAGRSLSSWGISANFVTLSGVGFAAFSALTSPHLWAALFLIASVVADGLDGSLAILDKRESKLGSLFDALADRLSEAFWALALYQLGIPIALVIAIWSIASIQEFARARLGSDGIRDIGVITVAERRFELYSLRFQ